MERIDEKKRYPMGTLAEARKSAIQAALDCRYGHITQKVYEIVRDKCHARIKELDKQELEQYAATPKTTHR